MNLLDNFNRADSGSLGSNWSRTTFIAADPSIVSNQAFVSPGAVEVAALWNVARFNADQEMQLILATGDGSNCHIYMFLVADKTGDPGDDMYLVDLTLSGSTGSGTLNVDLYRRNSGSFTQIGTTFGPWGWTAGDTWGARKVAGNIDVIQGVTVIHTFTDSTPLTHSGYVGFGGRLSTQIKIDDFSGGSVGATASTDTLFAQSSGRRASW